MLERISPKGLFYATAAILIVCLAIVLSLLSTPDEANLTVAAKTEVMSIELSQDTPLPGYLSGPGWRPQTDLCSEDESEFAFAEPIGNRVVATIATASNGAIEVRFEPKGEEQYGVLFCAEDELAIASPLTMRSSGAGSEMVTIVAQGNMTLGAVPGSRPGQNQILRSGSITATSSSYPLSSGQATQTSALRMGDRLSFEAGEDAAPSKSWLVARHLRDQNVFDVVVQTDAQAALVNRIGQSSAFKVSRTPSVWSRLEAQSEWALVLLIIAILLNLLAALQHYMETRK